MNLGALGTALAMGITVSGVCCTSNEVTMRHGIPMAPILFAYAIISGSLAK